MDTSSTTIYQFLGVDIDKAASKLLGNCQLSDPGRWIKISRTTLSYLIIESSELVRIRERE
jgi:hypothetical protein